MKDDAQKLGLRVEDARNRKKLEGDNLDEKDFLQIFDFFNITSTI